MDTKKKIKFQIYSARRKDKKKLDLTSFKDGEPDHSVDLHMSCSRCMAAKIKGSKPGDSDGEFMIPLSLSLHVHHKILIVISP